MTTLLATAHRPQGAQAVALRSGRARAGQGRVIGVRDVQKKSED
jgi:hypothetical protein